MLGVKLSQNLRTLIPSDVRLFLGAFSELLGMTVDRLARAGTDIVGDLAPVLAVDLDSLEEALVLFVTPVALTLATLMLDNAFRSLDYLIRSFRDSLFDLCLSLALSFQIALAHLGQKLFLFEGADNLCRVVVLSVDLSGAIANDRKVDHTDGRIPRNGSLQKLGFRGVTCHTSYIGDLSHALNVLVLHRLATLRNCLGLHDIQELGDLAQDLAHLVPRLAAKVARRIVHLRLLTRALRQSLNLLHRLLVIVHDKW